MFVPIQQNPLDGIIQGGGMCKNNHRRLVHHPYESRSALITSEMRNADTYASNKKL